MANFEEVGRTLDREFAKLRRFLAGEVKPATERQLVVALRAASRHLGELAEKLESRGAAAPRKD